jgi:hypothetical protein
MRTGDIPTKSPSGPEDQGRGRSSIGNVRSLRMELSERRWKVTNNGQEADLVARLIMEGKRD